MTNRRPLGRLVVVLCVINVVVALDFLGASVLLHSVGRDLHMSTAELTWVVNGYLLTLAAPLIAMGGCADSVGAIRMTRMGLVVFALGALASGLAGSAEVLIVGRMAQGLGASALAATGLSLVSSTAAEGDRGRVVGIWAGVGAVGSAAGPLLGGSLAALGSWRIFFLIDVPIAIMMLVLLRRARDPGRPAQGLEPRAGSTVWSGLKPAALLTVGLGFAVFAMLAGPDSGWGSTAVALPAAVAVALLAAFVVLDRRSARPIFDRNLFGRRYSAIAATAFVGNGAFAVVSFFASLYLQQVQDMDPLEAGAVFLAMTIPLVVLSPLVGRVTRPSTVRPLMAGGLVVVAGSVALFAVLSTSTGTAILVGALVLTGVGQSVVFNVSNVAAMDGDVNVAGLESGMINEVRQLGALIGLAVVGAFFAAGQHHPGGNAAAAFTHALVLPSVLLAGVCLAVAATVLAFGNGQPAARSAG